MTAEMDQEWAIFLLRALAGTVERGEGIGLESTMSRSSNGDVIVEFKGIIFDHEVADRLLAATRAEAR
tara:strand:+ start:345 stop:548 length:204 start_codon:yes stop_codon:yes gene_type:complete